MIENIEFNVVGVTKENRQNIIKKYVGCQKCSFQKDIDNEYDKFAIKVLINNECVGFVPRYLNEDKEVVFNELFYEFLDSITDVVANVYFNSVGVYGIKIYCKVNVNE